MGIELAKAYVRVRGDTSQVAKDFRKGKGSVEGAAKGMASSVNRILAGIGLGAGLAVLSSKMREFTALAERQIQAEQRLTAVVKATGMAAGFTAKQLMQQAAALQKVTTVGDEEIMELQAILLTFRSITGKAFEETTEMVLDLANVMGTDAKSGALQLAKVLENPTKNLSALTRSGVTFSQQQEDQIKNLASMNRLGEAQALILEVVGKQFGGVSRAMAETDSGKLIQMRNVLSDMREELGKKLIPAQMVFLKLQSTLLDVLEPVIETVAKNLVLMVKLGGAFLAAKLAIIAVSLVIRAYTAATKAAAGATMFLLALSGPAGWVKLAAGAAAATVAILVMNDALKEAGKEAVDEMGKTEEGLAKVKAETAGLTEGVGNLGTRFREVGQAARKFGFEFLQDLRKINAELMPPVDKLKEFEQALAKANWRATQLRTLIPDAYQAAATEAIRMNKQLQIYKELLDDIEKKKGFESAKEAIQALRDELYQANTGVSDLTMAIMKLAQTKGVTPEQIASLKTMQKGLEEVRKKNEAIDKAKEKAKKVAEKGEEIKKRFEEAGKRLTRMVRTPIEVLRARLKGIFTLLGAGQISEETARRRIAQLREGLVGQRETITGRTGFANFGKQIQDLVMGKKSDMQRERMIQLLEIGNQKLDENKGAIENIKPGLA